MGILTRLTATVYLLQITVCTVYAGNPLDKYIQHYEGLNYDRSELHERHIRAKRSLDSGVESERTVELQFSAHGRKFHLRMKRDNTLFVDGFVVQTSEGEDGNYDTSHIYSGKLHDEPGSLVHGTILEGLFEGKIYSGEDEYYIEPSSRYFNEPTDYHSVIYNGKDVHYPYPHGAQCGLSDATKKWMQSVQEQPALEASDEMGSYVSSSKEMHHPQDNKYTDPAKRKKRALNELNTCTLYIQTDHQFTAAFDNNDQVISQIVNYLGAINAIYRRTNFGGMTDISFAIKRIRINGTEEQNDPSNPFRFDNIGVEKFLDLNSEQNHNDYCLAYIFSNRDFEGGVLGLAWIAYPYAGSTGGICERYKQLSTRKASFNTGIITIQNYGSRVTTKASHITLAHEIGHNFGSPHDYPLECRPGDSDDELNIIDGNYIMYAMARKGNKLNNNKFSECSIGNMTLVLNAKKDRCFIETLDEFCGNGIVEGDEECDCGFSDQCDEICCYPQTEQGDPMACQLKLGANCSPSQGPCCNEECNLHQGGETIMCDSASECNEVSYCDGQNAKCPAPVFYPDRTPCNENRQVCFDGECSGSICEAEGVLMEECFCEGEEFAENQKCHVCCQQPDNGGTCQSSADILSLARFYPDVGERVITMQPGAPCENDHGYCDVYSKCRLVDADGPLARLKTALLDPDARKEWIDEYWWAILIIVIGVLVLSGLVMTLLICCTPTSNPRLPERCTCNRQKKPKSKYEEGTGDIRHVVDSSV